MSETRNLKTHPDMTPQEMFDIAVRGIFTQGGPSVDMREGCLYRSDDGFRCAVGHLIPDEWVFEGGGVRDVIPIDLPRGAFGMLDNLQSAHDNASEYDDDFLTGFEARARGVAAQHGLSAACLDKCVRAKSGGEA